MGNSPSSPLESCLANALTSRADFSLPKDPFYQLTAVKPYNTAFSITPAAVTRPRSADEVAAVVKCATDQGLKVQARSGGHSYADFCIGGKDGAVVVDLTHFQQFSMDTTTWQATIGAGTLLGDVTQRLNDHGGRAMAHGVCPQVSVRSDFRVRILCFHGLIFVASGRNRRYIFVVCFFLDESTDPLAQDMQRLVALALRLVFGVQRLTMYSRSRSYLQTVPLHAQVTHSTGTFSSCVFPLPLPRAPLSYD